MEYSRYEEPDWHLHEASSESGTGSAITWLLVGAGVGAGIALLLAPTSGRELRAAIGRAAGAPWAGSAAAHSSSASMAQTC